MDVLPEWNGNVVGTMHRMGMTVQALAVEMRVQRTYASKVLNSPNNGIRARSRVENALRSFAGERGIEFEELWPAEKRPAEVADTGAAESVQENGSGDGKDHRSQPEHMVGDDKPEAHG